MKRLILALLLIPTFAYADIAILLRNGAIIHWSEMKGAYDRFCINQINIIGIAVGDREKLPSERMGEMDVDPLNRLRDSPVAKKYNSNEISYLLKNR